MSQPLELTKLQEDHGAWADRNFPGQRTKRTYSQPGIGPLLGVMEELGELAHAVLKAEQGIRGKREEHEAAARDAVGDIVIYLLDFCNARGWSLEEIIQETWEQVSKRDWQANPQGGTAPTPFIPHHPGAVPGCRSLN